MSRTWTIGTSIVALMGLLSLAACSGGQQSQTGTPQDAAETETPSTTGRLESASPEPAADTTGPPTPQALDAPRSQATTTDAPVTPPASDASAGNRTPPPARTSQTTTEPPPPAPAKVVAVPATKPGLTRVGADKCKMCHKVQHASWAASAHATGDPPLLDCEACHGPGSEYKTISIMRDPEKAKAAGLVVPGKSFCTENCHAAKWKDDMIGRVHAHKGDAIQG